MQLAQSKPNIGNDDTIVNGVSTREEGRSWWRAQGLHVVVMEDDTTVCQGVDVRRGDLRWTMESDVSPSLILKENRKLKYKFQVLFEGI